MKAIVLAAGYATRLRPLTDHIAKPLLPIAGRPIVDHLCAKIDEVPEVDTIHLVTNHRFAPSFIEWAAQRAAGGAARLPVVVHDDGTRSNEDRKGAIGDVQLTIERAGLAGEDLLVVAGDNLFEFALADQVAFFREKGDGSCIALFEEPDLELVKAYSAVTIDADERVVSFVEKPSSPTTHLVGIATYVYHRDHVPLVRAYLAEGHSPDQPGRFIAWLHQRVPVYGYRFAGAWLDIGDRDQLLVADNAWRAKHGQPARAEYALP